METIEPPNAGDRATFCVEESITHWKLIVDDLKSYLFTYIILL
ncbi:hypothetical protein [Rossellomorea vietnamensis]|nr:hypothetical protein [Rossellomorea vietnamensis]